MSFIAGYILGLEEGGGGVIQSITITRNGTYTAPEGVDGYNPVVVNNPYETLYKTEHGDMEKIDTGVTDDEGNPITADGLPIGDGGDGLGNANNLTDIEFKDGEGNLSFGVSDGNNVVCVEIDVKKTDIYIPSLTVTNLKDGKSKTVTRDGMSTDWYFSADITNFGGAIRFKTSYTKSGSYPYGIELAISLSDIGIDYLNWSTVQWYIIDNSSILGG